MNEVKCPKCNHVINHLRAYSLEENEQCVELDGSETDLDWDTSDVVDGSCRQIEFVCPSCGVRLFVNKGDSRDQRVIDFLKTGEYYPDAKVKVEFT